MPARAGDEDLVRPTLTEEDDAVGFDRPWNPWSLVLLTFFFGLASGGTLLALNFRRLGQPARVPAALAAVAIGTVLLTGTHHALLAAGLLRLGDTERARLFNLAESGIATLIAMALAARQRRRTRLARVWEVPAGPLVVPGCVAAVGSIALQVALGLLFRVGFGWRSH